MMTQLVKRLMILCLAGLSILSACNEPDLIGLDLLPEDIQPGVRSCTLSVKSYTVLEDSLVVWSTVKNLLELPGLFLGSYDDPYAGKTFAGFVTQVRIGNTITPTTFSGTTTPDSIVLSFLYKEHTGDTTVQHHISVYELADKIYSDSVYYSNRQFSRGQFLGHVDLKPSLRDSVTVGATRLPPMLRIPLDTALGGRIMREYIANPATFGSNAAFNDFLKGFILTDSADGRGSILSMTSTSGFHRLTIYFSGNKSYEFVIDVNAVRFSNFRHEYLTMNTDSITDETLVVASMAGLKDSLVIQNLDTLFEDGPVSISSARLTFTVKEGSSDYNFNPHGNLLIFASDSVGQNTTTADATESASYYGGAYNSTAGTYTFNVARYLQQTLKKVVEQGGRDYGLFLVAGGSTSNSRRTVLKGGDDIQLIITTTKINP